MNTYDGTARTRVGASSIGEILGGTYTYMVVAQQITGYLRDWFLRRLAPPQHVQRRLDYKIYY